MQKKSIQKYQNFQKLEKNPKKAFFEKNGPKLAFLKKSIAMINIIILQKIFGLNAFKFDY